MSSVHHLRGRVLAGLAIAAIGCHQRARVSERASDPAAAVQQELAARYLENEAGFMARDPDRVMRLRHAAFHTITPDGKVSTLEQMYQRTRDFIARIERFGRPPCLGLVKSLSLPVDCRRV